MKQERVAIENIEKIMEDKVSLKKLLRKLA
jgi:hypothetical protein